MTIKGWIRGKTGRIPQEQIDDLNQEIAGMQRPQLEGRVLELKRELLKSSHEHVRRYVLPQLDSIRVKAVTTKGFGISFYTGGGSGSFASKMDLYFNVTYPRLHKYDPDRNAEGGDPLQIAASVIAEQSGRRNIAGTIFSDKAPPETEASLRNKVVLLKMLRQ
jgi:hypothetical protein